MIVKLFAVYDDCSRVYDGPVPAQTEELAMRNFKDMLMNPNSVISKHPENFSLWIVGNWDDSTGEVIPLELGKKRICHALDLTGDELNA